MCPLYNVPARVHTGFFSGGGGGGGGGGGRGGGEGDRTDDLLCTCVCAPLLHVYFQCAPPLYATLYTCNFAIATYVCTYNV